jgi:hypothetical protein
VLFSNHDGNSVFHAISCLGKWTTEIREWWRMNITTAMSLSVGSVADSSLVKRRTFIFPPNHPSLST